MTYWLPFTLVRATLFYVAGIVLAIYFPGTSSPFWIGVLTSLFILLLWAGRWLLSRDRHNYLGIAGLTALALLGLLAVIVRTHSPLTGGYLSKELTFDIVLLEEPQSRARSMRALAECVGISKDGLWQNEHARIQVYFVGNQDAAELRYGDRLLVKAKLVEIETPWNPHEFDYRRFLSHRGIYYQIFAPAGSWQFVVHDPPSALRDWASRAREWSSEVIEKRIEGQREQAVTLALLLGLTGEIDTEVLQAYAASGAMHVLAVSGLHVGILYAILLFVLSPLRHVTGGEWWIAGISLFILWTFAFVTGLTPSVLRAVTMFSFLAVARPWGKAVNIYNTLAASALVLLLADPYMIMSVGFQLSYLAVLGILYIHPKLYSLWEPQNRFVDKVWQITSVALAAQAATFTLGMLYFHQFPVYFLFSNLVVIPGSFVVLVVGLAMLMVNIIEPLANLLGIGLTWIVKAINASVFWVEDLPLSLVQNIWISEVEYWLLTTALLFFILFLERRKLIFISLTSTLMVAYSVTRVVHIQAEVRPRGLTVYRIPGEQVIEFHRAGKAISILGKTIRPGDPRLAFHARPNRAFLGIREQDLLDTAYRDGNFWLRWHETSIYVMNHSQMVANSDADILVIGHNAVGSLSTLPFRFRQLILDTSNSRSRASRLAAEAANLGIPVHSVWESGAFVAR